MPCPPTSSPPPRSGAPLFPAHRSEQRSMPRPRLRRILGMSTRSRSPGLETGMTGPRWGLKSSLPWLLYLRKPPGTWEGRSRSWQSKARCPSQERRRWCTRLGRWVQATHTCLGSPSCTTAGPLHGTYPSRCHSRLNMPPETSAIMWYRWFWLAASMHET